MTVLYRNFGTQAKAFNQDILHTRMTRLGNGDRVYLNGDQPYAGPIHFIPIAEAYDDHKQAALSVSRDTISNDPDLPGIYMGTAGLVNLEYMARARSPAALLYDINPVQTLFWREISGVLAETPKKENFAAYLRGVARNPQKKLSTEFCKNAREAYPKTAHYDNLFKQNIGIAVRGLWTGEAPDFLSRWPWENRAGWLVNKDLYAHLHEMAKADAIGAVTLDITDRAAIDALSQRLQNCAVTPIESGSGSLCVSGSVSENAPEDAKRLNLDVALHHSSNVLSCIAYSNCQLAGAARAEENIAKLFGDNIETGRHVRCDHLTPEIQPAADLP